LLPRRKNNLALRGSRLRANVECRWVSGISRVLPVAPTGSSHSSARARAQAPRRFLENRVLASEKKCGFTRHILPKSFGATGQDAAQVER